MDLSLFWFALIVGATLMYILMDGFDLGIGVLFAVIHKNTDRDVMVNSVAPVWDGNETWLVMGGAALFGAFPAAYALVAEALTIPLTVMLLGLIFRGVAFEFRFNAAPRHRRFWDNAFFAGSVVATFAQGVVVGAVVQGINPGDVDAWGWLTPFTLFCGVGLMAAYGLLGATWLVLKCSGPLQARIRRITVFTLAGLLFFIVAVSVWTLQLRPAIAARWFSWPGTCALIVIPVMVALISIRLWRTLFRESHVRHPFLMALGLVFLGFAGLGISLWPYIIPPTLTLWQAAAPLSSQRFMLPGALFILPVILAYTGWSYWVFRGKVQQGEGWH